MVGSCISVAYITLRSTAGCFSIRFLLFFLSVLYFMAHCVFPVLVGQQAVVSDTLMPEC